MIGALIKPLWMVIYINGYVAGVFLNEPVPDGMTFEECEANAAMRNVVAPKGVVYKCVYDYGKPVNTGPYRERLE